ncbi:MFS transporter [Solirubrobacter phytolaccae]|uniref:MFS transporter n=1 Tax=Solirubrobacter phytolaccae TaxID=1404360 RepID=A0A9X3SCB7_9ACTN|nr:MFS transporter [Solirubrobacter phytolaccae]MDA0184461.1 MFS transporter [Solirubrobacter phytolaccae]
MRRLLAHRDARLFLIGQSLSLLGDTALWLALGLWVKELTGSSSAAGLVFLCIVAPGLLSPLGGLLVDRMRRRTLLIVVNPLTALAVLPLLLVKDASDVWLIYVVATLYGTSYVVLAAGQSALLTTLLPADLLPSANATLQTVREGLRFVAPVAGAGLYTVAGGGAVAILDATTFLLATGALLALKLREPRPQPDPTHWVRATAAGARHIGGVPELKRLVLGSALCMLVIGFGETVIFELPRALGKPDSFYGVLMAIGGIGAITGALTATRVMARRGETALTALGITIFAIGCLLMMDSYAAVILTGKVLFNFGIPWMFIGMVTLLQRSTPGPLQGRAFAASEFALGLPQTLGIALGAGLVALLDYRLLLLVQAAVTGATGVYLLIRMRGSWRPWSMISTTSWSMLTARRAHTRGRSWPRWRRSGPRR